MGKQSDLISELREKKKSAYMHQDFPRKSQILDDGFVNFSPAG